MKRSVFPRAGQASERTDFNWGKIACPKQGRFLHDATRPPAGATATGSSDNYPPSPTVVLQHVWITQHFKARFTHVPHQRRQVCHADYGVPAHPVELSDNEGGNNSATE